MPLDFKSMGDKLHLLFTTNNINGFRIQSVIGIGCKSTCLQEM